MYQINMFFVHLKFTQCNMSNTFQLKNKSVHTHTKKIGKVKAVSLSTLQPFVLMKQPG